MSLPNGYKRLEYIQSTGTQYIDSGFIPNQDTRLEMVCSPLSVVDANDGSGFIPYGAGESYTSRAFECYTANSQYEFNYDGQYGFIGSPSTGQKLSISHNKNEIKLIIDGSTTLTKSFNYQSFTAPYTMTLFAIHRSSVIRGLMKLYACQIYDNGALIRDYIPCQTTAGEVGLWDDVNEVFYGNAGTGTFTAGPAISIAADKSEITKLEYIQSSGTQWIDTGFKPNQDTRVVMNCYVISFNSCDMFLFGTRVSAGNTAFYVAADDTNTKWFISYGSDVQNPVGTCIGHHSIDMNKNSVSIDDAITTLSASTFQSASNLLLFATNTAGSADSQRGTMNLYSCQIYDNGTIIRDYIPAKLSDGTLGLYDKLHGLLYINAGSGAFISGPEVPKAPPTPSGFTSGRLTDTTVHFTWTASDGATGYKLYKNGALIATLTDTSYTDTVQVFSSTVYAATAYNDDGESEATTLDYYAAPENPILYLVTDRTAADVDACNENGTYNVRDLNRVGEAMNYVADRLRAAGYDPHINPKTDWKDGEWVDPEAQAVYLGDLAELRKQFTLYEATPEVPPDLEKLNYIEANSIEKILVDIDTLLTNIAAGWLYSGEINSGEV